MTQKAINYAEVLCELNIDAAELSDMEAVVRENPELQEALTCPVVSREKKSEIIDIRRFKDYGKILKGTLQQF